MMYGHGIDVQGCGEFLNDSTRGLGDPLARCGAAPVQFIIRRGTSKPGGWVGFWAYCEKHKVSIARPGISCVSMEEYERELTLAAVMST